MIILYLNSINKIIRDPDPKVFEELGYDDLLWIDLVVPTAKERKLVESFLDVNLLTRQQAEEIETSSRYSELEDSIIEGMVHLRDIDGDFYRFDEERYEVYGTSTGKVYTLGDKVRVRVKATDLRRRTLDFELVNGK